MKPSRAPLSLICLALFTSLLLPPSANAFTPTAPLMNDYYKVPTFISESEQPSTMIILDSSGSMRNFAYRELAQRGAWGAPGNWCGTVQTGFDPANEYYGYFDNTAYYSWDETNDYFEKCDGDAGSTCSYANAPWSGNFLNWLTMRRVDVAKKVLTGGRVDTTDPAILIAHPNMDRDLYKVYDDRNTVVDINGNNRHVTPFATRFFTWSLGNGTNQSIRLYSVTSQDNSCGTSSWVIDNSSTIFEENVRIQVHPNDQVNGTVEGVIQQNADDIRFGLTIFDTDDGDANEDDFPNTTDLDFNGGEVIVPVGSTLANVVSSINSTPADSWTPLAETLYTVAGNYMQESSIDITTGPRYATDAYTVGPAWDPFYFSNNNTYVSCSKPFVIVITDGEPTQDTYVPSPVNTAGDSVGGVTNPFSNNSGLLENVAYWAHTSDLRSDLDDEQSMILYTVFAFGSGNLLRDAAINGSFIDRDGNGLPNSAAAEAAADLEDKEWDFDDDGVADHYAEASDGEQLEEALSAAMNDILRNLASGTASSVISSSRRGEGAAFQAIFIPEYLDQSNHEVAWIGDLNAMFKDNYGNLREDTDQNGQLDFAIDRVARVVYNNDRAQVELYYDADGDGTLELDEDVDNDRAAHLGAGLDACDHNEDLDFDGHLDVMEDLNGNRRLDGEDVDGDCELDVIEDLNGNGIFDRGEDLDQDGHFDDAVEDFDGDCALNTFDEDVDGDGVLDIAEDIDGDGVLDTVNEDLNGNGILDLGEDLDGDGNLDVNEDFDGDGSLGTVAEDLDGDGIMDIDEDLDGDGTLDLGEDVNCNGILDSEDIDGDCRLDLANEDIDGDGRLDYEEDVDGDGVCDTSEAVIDATVDLLNMRFLWSAGKNLATMTDAQTDNRNIITSFDSSDIDAGAREGWIMPYDVRSFSTTGTITSVPNINGYFNLSDYDNDGVTSDTDRNMLIDYIRGNDNAAFRSREIWLDANQDGTDDTPTTWRLGDIINSSPISVSTPMENYDLLYNDESYRVFAKQYLKRRHVLYVGSNDGMLRAINAGFYDKSQKKVWRNLNPNYNPYDGDTTNDNEYEDSGPMLGDELWAYLPYNLLPHLQWQARNDYSHVYYVDKQSRIADVKIFAPDTTHPGGWGTILIGGMRFGGGPITVDSDGDGVLESNGDDRTLSSAYFVLDITDPEQPPVFLGEFTFDDFSFTTSNPTVIQMKNSSSPNEMDWYLTFGTGPTTLMGQSEQRGKVYIMKLSYDPENNANGLGTWVTSTENTAPVGKNWYAEVPEDESFVSDIISVDFEIGSSPQAFMDDAIYFGSVSGGWRETDTNGNGIVDNAEDDFDNDGVFDTGWSGALYRIIINDNTDTDSWFFGANNTAQQAFVDIGAPITAAPSITTDSDNNIWVYAGTGRYFDEVDDTDQDSQYMIGVMEPNDGLIPPSLTAASVSMNDLLDVTFADVYRADTATDAEVTGVTGVTNFQELTDSIENNYSGWKKEMVQGLTERILSSPLIFGGVVFFNSYAPNREVCTAGGASWAYGVYYKTGTAYYDYDSILGFEPGAVAGDPERNLEFLPGGTGKGGRIVIDDPSGEGKTVVNIQSSTGEIQQIEVETPIDTDSGRTFWKDEF